ncbi:MAG: HAMP domain-containing protein [Candidatus Accumulibacter sp.]|uniref:HAMP domain-containing protein n=1 Tax=Candidatus Accumulibacter proximus TaxID=2954385 RepID=A0A935UFZ5_9PROT|nr:HAMP domain-containing protein [Candidatus Accumulibacter proximus]
MIARTYADGDLTRRAAVEGKDEVAAVAGAFNRLMESFATIVGKPFSTRSRSGMPREG